MGTLGCRLWWLSTCGSVGTSGRFAEFSCFFAFFAIEKSLSIVDPDGPQRSLSLKIYGLSYKALGCLNRTRFDVASSVS